MDLQLSSDVTAYDWSLNLLPSELIEKWEVSYQSQSGLRIRRSGWSGCRSLPACMFVIFGRAWQSNLHTHGCGCIRGGSEQSDTWRIRQRVTLLHSILFCYWVILPDERGATFYNHLWRCFALRVILFFSLTLVLAQPRIVSPNKANTSVKQSAPVINESCEIQSRWRAALLCVWARWIKSWCNPASANVTKRSLPVMPCCVKGSSDIVICNPTNRLCKVPNSV